MKDNLITAQTAAADISRSAHTANWLRSSGADPTWAAYQESIIDSSFAVLAKALGYRVEKIEEPTVDAIEAADRAAEAA